MKFNGKNIQIGENVKLGKNTRIGDNSIIYDNVVIGDNSVICNNCVIGEPLSNYYDDTRYKNPITTIGKNALIRSHSLIYAQVIVGDYFSTGHRVTIREDTIFGDGCRVGTLSDIQGKITVGDYCWFHSNVFIAQNSKIGNYVFIYPHVVFANDPHPPSNVCIGPSVGDFSQISANVVLLPGVQIGENCLVGAHSVVTRDIADYSVAVGNPARLKCDIREIESREKKKETHYPWMFNFNRGMPWEKIGYEEWINIHTTQGKSIK